MSHNLPSGRAFKTEWMKRRQDDRLGRPDLDRLKTARKPPSSSGDKNPRKNKAEQKMSTPNIQPIKMPKCDSDSVATGHTHATSTTASSGSTTGSFGFQSATTFPSNEPGHQIPPPTMKVGANPFAHPAPQNPFAEESFVQNPFTQSTYHQSTYAQSPTLKSSDAPKAALHAAYGKPPRRKVISQDNYFTWNNNGPPHLLKWSSIFICPLTGEVFSSGRWPGGQYAIIDGFVWYPKKLSAEHAAAARALDCFHFRDGVKTSPLGEDEPYLEMFMNLPAGVPQDIQQKVRAFLEERIGARPS